MAKKLDQGPPAHNYVYPNKGKHAVVSDGECVDGVEQFTPKGTPKATGETIGRAPDGKALAGTYGLSAGEHIRRASPERPLNIDRPGYPMKGDGTSATTGDNGVKGTKNAGDNSEPAVRRQHDKY